MLPWPMPQGLVAGVDEAGRGPLAGPVVAAAVILDERQPIAGLMLAFALVLPFGAAKAFDVKETPPAPVEKGMFRRDLLYRIKVARLQLTPLRERPTDIPLLVHAFLGQFRSVMEKSVLQVSPEALQVLTAYPWPGNVRELKSAVESALIHCKGTVVQVGDLPPEIRHPEPKATYVPLQREDERTRMVGALQQTGGNRSEAARLLGMSRRTFYRRLAEYDVAASEEAGQDWRP